MAGDVARRPVRTEDGLGVLRAIGGAQFEDCVSSSLAETDAVEDRG